MRLLVLNADRDDDLGRKTGIRGPVIGRDEVLRAATALAVADPEEADANGMFAAVKEFDDVSRRKDDYGAEEVFVAAVTGHVREGSYADNAIAHQIDEILAQTKCDAVILVTDGGEDEHVIPILQTRAKVNGTRRVIIKQAKNLEGFLYLLSRLINDEKLQKRFFIPLAILFIAAGASVLLNEPDLFIASALFLAAFYIFVQVFRWQEPIGGFFEGIAKDLRAGKLSFFASVVAFLAVVAGGFFTLNQPNRPGLDEGRTAYVFFFVRTMYWWIVAAILIVLLGRGTDRYIREHVLRARYWETLIFVAAGATILYAFLGVAEILASGGQLQPTLIDLTFLTLLCFGGFLVFTGLIAHQYFARLAQGPPTPLEPLEQE